MIYSKNKIVEYVEKWCWENGLNYTKKKCSSYSGFGYLECY